MTLGDQWDLPQPRDAFDEKLLDDVRRYGWHCVLVADEHHPEHAAQNAALGPHPIYDAAFAYTVGVEVSFAHPELILVGRWQHAHPFLAQAVSLVKEGHRFAPGDSSTDVLDGYPVRFGVVSDFRRIELLTCVDWLNRGRAFSALQLILPDRAGRWPDDPAYDAYPQPLLA
ncbi:MAG: DUF4262 domain-containing protein [Actinomycetota bacterium]|nr:DUF4262 domain-containing protein [Actinomycetota bacterium]